MSAEREARIVPRRLYFRPPENWAELTEEQRTAWAAKVAAALLGLAHHDEPDTR